jgi:antitoxin (DNA-binding transcriptional repressor) of toxin-antitoxin stability system
MTTLTIAEAQSRLREVIQKLNPGDEVALTQDDQIVARIVGDARPVTQRPGPGLLHGMLEINVDDDEHLQDFEEYMP